MLNFAICEISGKQYKISPDHPVMVDWVGDSKIIEVNVLFASEDGKIKIGKPYLKEKLILKSLGNLKSDKIRVSKYHNKSNSRRVRGSRALKTKVVWDVKNTS